jgi:hypothetical protein
MSRITATEALVSEIPEEKKEPAMPGGGNGGMGGMYRRALLAASF